MSNRGHRPRYSPKRSISLEGSTPQDGFFFSTTDWTDTLVEKKEIKKFLWA